MRLASVSLLAAAFAATVPSSAGAAIYNGPIRGLDGPGITIETTRSSARASILCTCGEARTARMRLRDGRFSYDRTFANGYRLVVRGRRSGSTIRGTVRAFDRRSPSRCRRDNPFVARR